MRDPEFFAEHNARHFWHPMAHPAEMLKNPPVVVAAAEGVEITDVNGHRALDAVGGLWNVNLGYSCQPVKDAISEQLANDGAAAAIELLSPIDSVGVIAVDSAPHTIQELTRVGDGNKAEIQSTVRRIRSMGGGIFT